MSPVWVVVFSEQDSGCMNNKHTGVFNPKKGSHNTKFFRESDRKTWTFPGDTKWKFWEFWDILGIFPKNSEQYQKNFYLYMALLKQHLLELSSPVSIIQYLKKSYHKKFQSMLDF